MLDKHIKNIQAKLYIIRTLRSGPIGDRIKEVRESITRSVQLPHIPVTAFAQTNLFKFEFTANSEPRRNLSDQSQHGLNF